MTSQFCNDVLKFLRSEYSDAYKFTIELYEQMHSCTAELKIKSSGFTRIISKCYMNYFYELYKHGDFISERNQFRWQKELIDLIEGG